MLTHDAEAASRVASVSTASVSAASTCASSTSIPTTIPCASVSLTARSACSSFPSLAQPSLPRYEPWQMRNITLWPRSTTTSAVSTAFV